MADNFVRGIQFDGETGLKTGADLEDLVTLASFAAGSGALDQATLEDDGAGAARVKDGGIDTDQLADGALSADATGRAKMADGFVNHDKLAASGRVPEVGDVDAFRAYLSADITNVAAGDCPKRIIFDTEDGDPSAVYDKTTGLWTPTKDGLYFVSAAAVLDDVAAGKLAWINLYEDTTVVLQGVKCDGTGLPERLRLPMTGLLWITTTPRTFSVKLVHDAVASKNIVLGSAKSWFAAHLVARIV